MIVEKLKIYLCGPIADCDDNEAKDWREYVKTLFPDSGIWYSCLDPMRRDYRGFDEQIGNRKMTWQIAKEIVEFDKNDIVMADVILAHLNPKKSSVGTHQEILYAWEKGKMVVLVTPDDMIISPWLMYHSQFITHSLNDGLDFIFKQYFDFTDKGIIRR